MTIETCFRFVAPALSTDSVSIQTIDLPYGLHDKAKYVQYYFTTYTAYKFPWRHLRRYLSKDLFQDTPSGLLINCNLRLYELGVSSKALNVRADNAHRFVFSKPDYFTHVEGDTG